MSTDSHPSVEEPSAGLPGLTLGVGLSLVAQGLLGYLASRRASKTALIPAIPGVLLALLGLLATDGRRRRPALIGAAVVAVLGCAGSGDGLPKLGQLLAGQPVARPPAVVAKGLMFATCAGYLAALGLLGRKR